MSNEPNYYPRDPRPLKPLGLNTFVSGAMLIALIALVGRGLTWLDQNYVFEWHERTARVEGHAYPRGYPPDEGSALRAENGVKLEKWLHGPNGPTVEANWCSPKSTQAVEVSSGLARPKGVPISVEYMENLTAPSIASFEAPTTSTDLLEWLEPGEYVEITNAKGTRGVVSGVFLVTDVNEDRNLVIATTWAGGPHLAVHHFRLEDLEGKCVVPKGAFQELELGNKFAGAGALATREWAKQFKTK